MQQSQKTQQANETQPQTVNQSRGFSLDLIPTGKFVTVEFINKYGALSRHNGRTGVKKYLKYVQFSNAQKGNYFVLWVRRGGIKFDSVAMVHKTGLYGLRRAVWFCMKTRQADTVGLCDKRSV